MNQKDLSKKAFGLIYSSDRQDNYEELKQLLIDGLDPNSLDEYSFSLLERACQTTNDDIVSLLLEKGAIVKTFNQYWPAFLVAADLDVETKYYKKNLNIIKKLVEYGSNLEENMQGWTALLMAIDKEKYELTRWLILKGANFNIKVPHDANLSIVDFINQKFAKSNKATSLIKLMEKTDLIRKLELE